MKKIISFIIIFNLSFSSAYAQWATFDASEFISSMKDFANSSEQLASLTEQVKSGYEIVENGTKMIAQGKKKIDTLVEQVKQAKQQYNQLTNMYEQGKNLVDYNSKMIKKLGEMEEFSWHNFEQYYNQMNASINQAKTFAGNMAKLAQTDAKFSGYKIPKDYRKAYVQWSRDTLDSIRDSYRNAGFQANKFETETGRMLQLRKASRNSEGQLQVLQASNEIADVMVEQLQKLRMLQLSQIQSQNAYITYEVNKQAANRARLDEIFVSTKGRSTDGPEELDLENLIKSKNRW